jgi:hypothetical protein
MKKIRVGGEGLAVSATEERSAVPPHKASNRQAANKDGAGVTDALTVQPGGRGHRREQERWLLQLSLNWPPVEVIPLLLSALTLSWRRVTRADRARVRKIDGRYEEVLDELDDAYRSSVSSRQTFLELEKLLADDLTELCAIASNYTDGCLNLGATGDPCARLSRRRILRSRAMRAGDKAHQRETRLWQTIG